MTALILLFSLQDPIDLHAVGLWGSFIYFNELTSNPANGNDWLDVHINEMSGIGKWGHL